MNQENLYLNVLLIITFAVLVTALLGSHDPAETLLTIMDIFLALMILLSPTLISVYLRSKYWSLIAIINTAFVSSVVTAWIILNSLQR